MPAEDFNFNMRFERPYDELLMDEIGRRVYFLTPGVESFQLVSDKSGIVGIRGTLVPGADRSSVEARLARGLSAELGGIRPSAPRILCDFDDIASGSGQEELSNAVSAGHIVLHSTSGVTLRGVLAELLEALDLIIRAEWSGFEAEEVSPPALVSLAILDMAGHLESFPQQLMLLDTLAAGGDAFEQFRNALNSGGSASEVVQRAQREHTQLALPPAICYSTYGYLCDSEPSTDTSVTLRGPAFRAEGRYHSPLQRMLNFTLREIVFYGSREFVDQSLVDVRNRTEAVARHLHLPGRCQSANDPFFMAAEGAERTNIQNMANVKIEMLLRLNPKDMLAVASFNRHGDYMTRRFRVDRGKGNVGRVTGCAGVGLERLLFAFISHHGVDPSNWPDVVIDIMDVRREALGRARQRLL